MRKWLSLLLSLVCLFSFSAVATAEDADFLSQIQGTFVELFPVLSEEQYHDAWLNNVTPLVGEEAAEDTVSYLLYMYTLSGDASSSSLQLLVRHTHTSVSRSSRCFFMLGFFRLNDFFGSVSINKTTFGGRMPVCPAIFFTFFLRGGCFARRNRSEP